jgi:aminomethyltransferase
MTDATTETLKRTPLYDLHVDCEAKLVPFAGYEMPVQFPAGVMEEHNWTRAHAGLFDVSHMGPCFLTLEDGIGGGDEAHAKIAAMIEELVPSDITSLKPGQARLTVLLNEDGGILDDLIITRPIGDDAQGSLYIVVNGAMKEQDWGIFEKKLAGRAVLTRADDRVLFALQGPEACDVMKDFFPGCEDLSFMHHMPFELKGTRCIVSRCGYTGEDGFEVLVKPEAGIPLVREMLTDERVKPIGLGARDSLRLEAGLCLYGHDLDPDIADRS